MKTVPHKVKNKCNLQERAINQLKTNNLSYNTYIHHHRYCHRYFGDQNHE